MVRNGGVDPKHIWVVGGIWDGRAVGWKHLDQVFTWNPNAEGNLGERIKQHLGGWGWRNDSPLGWRGMEHPAEWHRWT